MTYEEEGGKETMMWRGERNELDIEVIKKINWLLSWIEVIKNELVKLFRL